MFKTICISILIILLINYIVHFLKTSLTEPILRYIPEEKVSELKNEIINEITEPSKTETMKNELSNFLMEINI